ncbi:MAG TPA: hypothetical protein VM029_10015 [Opitutaceae bacterium]|nr:hypothetical protein [Opitutaceae bacterium]
MKKEIVGMASAPLEHDERWIDLEFGARVRLTSEDPGFPIESALLDGSGDPGWKAADAGEQSIWLDFEPARTIERIYLCFEAPETRTQEFVLSCILEGGVQRELVRQQFNFSSSSAREEETYQVGLAGVRQLKLTITPDISRGSARATLRRFGLQ